MPVTTVTLTRPAFPSSRPASTARAPRRALPRLVGALFGGFLTATAFPATSWWWMAPVGVAALVLSVSGSRVRLPQAAALGGVAGSAFAVASVGWLAAVAPEALAGVVVYFAVWSSLLLAGMSIVLQRRAGLVLVPLVWVTVEWLRASWPFGGFPWARLGFAAVDSPWEWLIPNVGVYGLSAVLVAAGSCLAALLLASMRRTAAPALAAAGVVVVALALPDAWHHGDPPADPSAGSSGSLLVAVIQGGPRPSGPPGLERRAVLESHARVTRELAAESTEQLDLVVWPENAADIDPLQDDRARRTVESAVAAVGAPVVVGALTESPLGEGRMLNQAIVWRPGSGPGPAYTKSRLVPFGEYVPFRSMLAAAVPSLSRVPRDMVPGDGPPTLDTGPVLAGVLICYEVAFDDKVRESVKTGGGLLLVPSNNATYEGTAQPLQQLAIERFRALETRRTVLVASTTGVSAIISPDGAIVGSVDEGRSGWVTARVAVREDMTPAVRFGAVVGGLLAAGGALAVMLVQFHTWRGRRLGQR